MTMLLKEWTGFGGRPLVDLGAISSIELTEFMA